MVRSLAFGEAGWTHDVWLAGALYDSWDGWVHGRPLYCYPSFQQLSTRKASNRRVGGFWLIASASACFVQIHGARYVAITICILF
jgi:hypothetical protein